MENKKYFFAGLLFIIALGLAPYFILGTMICFVLMIVYLTNPKKEPEEDSEEK